MNVSPYLLTALGALSVLLIALTVVTAARKLQRTMKERRRDRLAEQVRPRLLRLISGGTLEEVDGGLGRAEGDKLEELAVSLLGKLRGADRGALVAFLERRGVIDSARRRTYRPGAVGKARAAELLGAIGDTRAADDLVRLLAHRDADVRAAAARALGKLGDPSAVPHLLRGLELPRPVPASVVTMALVRIGPRAGEMLRQSLGNGSARAQAVAAELLGPLGTVSAADDLVHALRPGTQLNIRIAAARSLGRLGLPRTVAALRTCQYEDEPAELRLAAARAIGEIGDATGIAPLRQLLFSPDRALARVAAAGLANCGSRGRDALRYTLDGAELGAGATAAGEAIAHLRLVAARRRSPLVARGGI